MKLVSTQRETFVYPMARPKDAYEAYMIKKTHRLFLRVKNGGVVK